MVSNLSNHQRHGATGEAMYIVEIASLIGASFPVGPRLKT
jgi:hypothetical protein